MKSLPILCKNSQKSPCARRGVLVSRRLYARFAVNSSSRPRATCLAPAGDGPRATERERRWDTSNPSLDPVDRRAGGRHRRRREVPLRASEAHAPSEARSFGYGRVRLPLCRHSVLRLCRVPRGGKHAGAGDCWWLRGDFCTVSARQPRFSTCLDPIDPWHPKLVYLIGPWRPK